MRVGHLPAQAVRARCREMRIAVSVDWGEVVKQGRWRGSRDATRLRFSESFIEKLGPITKHKSKGEALGQSISLNLVYSPPTTHHHTNF